MKSNLCIDAGNTRLKAALTHPSTGEVLETFFQSEEQPSHLTDLQSFIAGRPIRAAIVSAVTVERDNIVRALRDAAIQPLVLDGRLALPVANAYASPDSLGADRIALACGAWLLHRGADTLVVSAGTCITYNLITRTGTFRGGAISPGMPMRLLAMHQFTDALPEVALQGDTRLLGYDTESSLRSGAVLGAIAEVDGFVTQFKSQYPGLKVLLTGGDAPLLRRYLATQIPHEPHLLFKGLHAILNYHMPHVAG